MSFLLRILHQLPRLLTGLVQSLLPSTPRSSTQIDLSSEGLVIGGHSLHLREESGLARDRRQVTINTLPDDVLVEIFFYVNTRDWDFMQNPWHALVHVCRRWRCLVFASPRRLNLRLEYEGRRPISKVLNAWPILPVILISGVELVPNHLSHQKLDQRWDNMLSALEQEHYDRICEIHIHDMAKSRWEGFAAAMQKPFPELTHLEVAVDFCVRVVPDSFLGGSAPRLRTLALEGIPFPSIPKLLLSTKGLVTLSLWNIPDSGYISPDAMATALKVVTRLETLHLRFRSPRFRPDPASRPRHPPTRFVLPALTELLFEGVHEYLEDLLSRVDAPLLYDLIIIFFMDLNFDVPQLHRLIGRAKEFKTFDHAEVFISDRAIQLSLYPKRGVVDHPRLLQLQINCRELDWQLSSLVQVCSSSFLLISTLEELEIAEYDYPSPSHRKDDMENAQWVELLDPFTALRNLYLTDRIAQRVCGALQELSGERAIEVLPALRNLFVRESWPLEPVQEAMVPFVAARQLSGHPVAIDHWRR